MYTYNLGALFTNVLSHHSDRTALNYLDKKVSYEELDGLVSSLCSLLLSEGCKRGDVIAIGNSKRCLSYALMLSCLRLGIAYVNIDLASPAARLESILQLSTVSLLFYDDVAYEKNMSLLALENSCNVFLLDADVLPSASIDDLKQHQELMRQVDGSSIAYIMFTSGSTGIPKGVAVTHQNVLHFIDWGKSYFNITEKDNFANLSPMYFDNSVFDFYIGLFSGASLTPVPRELLTTPYDLVPFVSKMGCSIWFSVPSLLIYLMAMKTMTLELLVGLRTIVFGGEGYPKVELKKLYDLFMPGVSLVNVYGPTECTCICSAHTLSDKDFVDISGLPTLGKLNPNFDYKILDEQDSETLTGELCLIGPSVAAGYFNDLERTSVAFHTLTEPTRFMKRMYRTGDLVREENGRLYFVGRKDNQIKHMGYRIELEEIEQALIKSSKVSQSAVIYHRVNTAYGKLVAFVACSVNVESKFLLDGLAALLPDYMIPQHIIIMDQLPKNPNGKIDRSRLTSLLEDLKH
ncbi:AMP-binding protein [Eionea flava]